MNVLVLFGSRSDRVVYSMVINELSKFLNVEMRVASAHRDPVLLREILQSTKYDLIVAGAGLAAHLPGVVSSYVTVPVIGLPVDGAMGGLDALLSILQMPTGIPVLTSGVNNVDAIVQSLRRFVDMVCNHDGRDIINIVCPEDLRFRHHYIECAIKDGLIRAGVDVGNITISNMSYESHINVVLADQYSSLEHERGCSIYVPIASELQRQDPSFALKLLSMTSYGGMWVGVNNIANGVISATRLHNLKQLLLSRGGYEKECRDSL